MKGFVKISRYAGMREDLVQAGGGNSSVKMEDGRMVIKASGYQLSEVTESEGYSIVNRMHIRDILSNKAKRVSLREADTEFILKESLIEGNRPSIETFLHAELSKYTLHTHPIIVNALTCRENWIEELRELFPNAYYVPYASPGIELAKIYYDIISEESKKNRNCKCPYIVFLQNHGLVVSSDTADGVIETTERVVASISEKLAFYNKKYSDVTDIWRFFPGRVVWMVKDIDVIELYRNQGIWNYRFCPDCVVFLGREILKWEETISVDDIEIFERTHGEPVLVGTEDSLYILADSVRKARDIESVLSFSAQVMNLNHNEECVFLTEAEQKHLLSREDEKYRKRIG